VYKCLNAYHSCLQEQEGTMKQTFRGESPFELWRKFRAFVPERRKAAAEPSRAEGGKPTGRRALAPAGA
jgi:hypothetical protein